MPVTDTLSTPPSVRRHALVTGGSAGIGIGIVRALCARGIMVSFCGRDFERGQAAERDFRSSGFAACFVAADVTTDEGTTSLVAKALKNAPIDILVNNVGNPSNIAGATRPWLEVDSIDWERTYYRNVINAKRLCDATVPAMCDRGWGRVVNISSAAGQQPGNEVPADYSVAKAALNALTMTLARAVAFTGVTVNTVTPGPILTDAQRDWIVTMATNEKWEGGFDDWERRFIRDAMRLTVNRLGSPEDIGRAVAFLVAEEADFITGENLRIDGGQTISAI